MTTPSSRRPLWAAFLGAALAAVLLSLPAGAAPEVSAADIATAQALFKEGKNLRERGDYEGAIVKLRAAFVLVDTPIIAMELAQSYLAVGKLVETVELLSSVPRIPLRKNESSKSDAARAAAQTLLEQVRARVATLVVKIGPTPAGVPSVAIDGKVIPPDAAGSPRILNPGKHEIVLRLRGAEARSEVTLKERETREVLLASPTPPAAPPTPIAEQPTSPDAPPPQPRSRRLLVYVGFGTAAVGLAAGAATGIVTLSLGSSVKSACRNGRCPPSAQGDLDTGRTLGTVSTAAFVVAGAGAVVGVLGLVLRTPRTAPATTGSRVTPWIGLGSAGLEGAF